MVALNPLVRAKGIVVGCNGFQVNYSSMIDTIGNRMNKIKINLGIFFCK
jgi:hypothetical protein